MPMSSFPGMTEAVLEVFKEKNFSGLVFFISLPPDLLDKVEVLEARAIMAAAMERANKKIEPIMKAAFPEWSTQPIETFRTTDGKLKA